MGASLALRSRTTQSPARAIYYALAHAIGSALRHALNYALGHTIDSAIDNAAMLDSLGLLSHIQSEEHLCIFVMVPQSRMHYVETKR
jgi:membrane protein YqaA with SNARE-associated domain